MLRRRYASGQQPTAILYDTLMRARHLYTRSIGTKIPNTLSLQYTVMPNIATVLKQEITRLARKEIKTQTDALRKSVTSLRSEVAALKRELKEQGASLRQAQRTTKTAKPTPDVEEGARAARFTAKGLASLRRRLELSASDFGRLIGASGQSVYGWEAGSTHPRARQVAAIAAVRSLGKKEARQRLAALAE